MKTFLARNRSKEWSSIEDIGEMYTVSGFREPKVRLLNSWVP